MSWVLGLDGGGSKTALAYANAAGEVVGPFYGPGVNPFDQPGWRGLLAELLRAHPAPGPLAHATLGLPGYGETEEISAEQFRVSRELVPAPVSVMNDVEVAFRGAFTAGVGVLLLAGTGSMAWGSDGERHVRAGGCGEGFGDEGSAHWIGREALSRVSQALDGRLHDPAFAAAMLDALGLNHGDPGRAQQALIGWYYGQAHARSAVAALARQVERLAGQGHDPALGLLDEAANLLAAHIRGVRWQLSQADLPWSYAGGVMQSSFMREYVSRYVGQGPQAPILPPLGGALWNAAQQAFGPLQHDWARRVKPHLLGPVRTST